jgi:hypothetical protein
VSYAVRITAAVVRSLSRLETTDPVGAYLMHGAIRGLAADPVIADQVAEMPAELAQRIPNESRHW